MPFGKQANLTELGWAKQSAQGTIPANPDYVVHGLLGYSLPEPTQNLQPRQPAAQRVLVQDIVKGAETWKSSANVPFWPVSSGPILKSILPTETVTGSNPYDHKFTPGTTDIWVSLFDLRPGSLSERFGDGLVESVTITFTSGKPLDFQFAMQGITPNRVASYTAGTTETMGPVDEWLTYVGSTVLFDIASTPASTDHSAYVEGGSIRVQRTLNQVTTADSGTITGFRRGPYDVQVQLNTTWQDYDAYRSTFYGSSAGSTPSTTVQFGSFSMTSIARFTSNRSAIFAVPKLQWQATPSQPQEHGTHQQQLIGTAVRPSSGDMCSWTVRNNKSGAY
jgi:hypothetical protein